MKKFILICSTFLGFAVTGLLAEDTPATVTLPTAPAPAATPAPGSSDSGTTQNQGGKKTHKGHKKHHKKKTDSSTDASTPAPKS